MPKEFWPGLIPPRASSSVCIKKGILGIDSSRFRLIRNEWDIAAIGGKALGDYGVGVAENYLNEIGVRVQREVWFEGPNGRFRADLFDPMTRTMYEVKTGKFELILLHYQINDYKHALKTHQAKRVLYVNVAVLGHKGFSEELVESLSGFGLIELD